MNRRSFLRGAALLPLAAVSPKAVAKVAPEYFSGGGWVPASVPYLIGERVVELPLVISLDTAGRVASFHLGGRRVGTIEVTPHPARIETLHVGDEPLIGPGHLPSKGAGEEHDGRNALNAELYAYATGGDTTAAREPALVQSEGETADSLSCGPRASRPLMRKSGRDARGPHERLP